MSAPCPVFGFLVELELANAPSAEQMSHLRLELQRDVLEPRGLVCDERGSGRRWSFVVRGEAGQATDADRCAIEAWAETRHEIASTRIGPLLDFASAA